MPSAIERDRKLAASGLVTVLMERQGSSQEDLEGFFGRHYPDSRALACTAAWLPLPQGRGLPSAALIGAEGKLLWRGNPISGEETVDRLIEQELERMRSGLGRTETEREVRRLIHGERDYEAADASIAEIQEAVLRARLTKEIDTVVHRELRAIGTSQETGFWLDAQKEAKAFAKAAGRKSRWTERAKALEKSFRTRKAKAEISAEKKLLRFLRVLPTLRKADQRRLAIRNLRKSLCGTSVEQRTQNLR